MAKKKLYVFDPEQKGSLKVNIGDEEKPVIKRFKLGQEITESEYQELSESVQNSFFKEK